MSEVYEAECRVGDPGDEGFENNLFKIDHPILVRQGLHEVGLEEVVTFILFYDRCEIEEALLAMQKPSDVYHPGVDFSIFCFSFSAAAEELFLGYTFIDPLLDFFEIQRRYFRPESDNLSIDRKVDAFNLFRSLYLLET